MDRAKKYKEVVDMLKEFEYKIDYFQCVNVPKTKILIEKINFLIKQKEEYYKYEQWRSLFDCDERYDIHYLQNSLQELKFNV